MHNALYLNTGTGRFLEAAYLAGLAATDWTWSVRLEDLDNDGRLDLFVTNGMIREYANEDLLERSLGSEGPQASRLVVRSSPKLAERHLAYRNLGDLRFEEVGAAWGLNQKGVAFGAAFGDFNGDGNLDLVYANYEAGVTFLRNDCDTGHSITVALRGTRSNSFGVGATVRIESALGQQVRQLVLARGYLSSSEPILHFGLGKDTRIERLTVSWPSGQTQAFTNLGVDRRFTITEPASPAAVPQAPPPRPPGQFSDVSEASGLSVPSHEGPRRGVRFTGAPADPVQPPGPCACRGRPGWAGRGRPAPGGHLGRSRPAAVPGRLGALRLRPGCGPRQRLPRGGRPVPRLRCSREQRRRRAGDQGGCQHARRLPAVPAQALLERRARGLRPAPDGSLPPLSISVGAVAAADFEHSGRLGVFLGGRVAPGRYPLSPQSALLANRGGPL